MFQEIVPILLKGSIRINSIPYEQLSSEEIAELETTERGVSIDSFREQSSEIILRAYCLLSDNFGKQGQQTIYETILQFLSQYKGDPWFSELGIFGARSIIDAFIDDEPNEVTKPFI